MESFGARLKRQREQRGITLDDISVSTKIGTRLLRALEEDHFDQLPGGIFNRGFVRAYAHHVGLDEEEIIAEYLAASGDSIPGRIPEAEAADGPAEAPAEEEEGAKSSGMPWGIVAGSILLVAVGVAVWGAYSRRKAPVESQEQRASQSARGPAPVAPPPPQSRPPQGSSDVATTAKTVKAPETRPAATEPPAPGGFVVRINAREDCWVSVKADGKEIMQDTLLAASEKSVAARREIVIRAGNVAALDLYFNGRKLSPQGDFGEVKTLTFDSSGLQPEPPKPPETTPALSPPSGPV